MKSDNQYIPDPALTKLKNIKKFIRGIAQILGLVAIVLFFIAMVIDYPKYKPYDEADASVVTGTDNGFVALSYFGVERSDSNSCISTELLTEHLSALKDNGFVTITQQDLFDYYQNRKPLPERALFLLFEDGRRNTVVYAQNILRDVNMKATILTYANNLSTYGNIYIKAHDLQRLLKNTYWEAGTNGYRLSYINVFDRYGHYLGELSPNEFAAVQAFLDRDYNHYLMDFIRDENGIPLESYTTMRERILADYDLMQQVYTDTIGHLPALYALMHSNTNAFGTNDRASDVNEQAIQSMFTVNFNREGYSLNTSDTNPFDLTRIQPQTYWSTNQLLMRIWDDTKLPIDFVTGDETRAAQWNLQEGAAEFKSDRVILTTLPSGSAVVALNGSSAYGDVSLSVRLLGNKLGVQRIWLRANQDATEGLAVELRNGDLCILSVARGAETEVFRESVDQLTNVAYVTKAEDSKNSLNKAIASKKKYASQSAENQYILSNLAETLAGETANASNAEEAYVPAIDLNTTSDHELTVSLTGDSLTVTIDGFLAVNNLSVVAPETGRLLLESQCTSFEGAYSQRNIYSDVYDGVFRDLTVTAPGSEVAFYRYTGTEMSTFQIHLRSFLSSLVNWFITNT